MFFRIRIPTHFQIFQEIMFNIKVAIRIITGSENISQKDIRHEWLNPFMITVSLENGLFDL